MFFLLSCIINGDLYRERAEVLQDYDGDGFSIQEGDCNDDNPAIKPTAIEVCDWLDNDCNGTVDDLLDYPLWFMDNDEDGFGDANEVIEACFPEAIVVDVAGDCDDGDSSVYPGMIESWENAFVDNDCDNEQDERTLSIDGWKPFTDLKVRGFWAEGGVALVLKQSDENSGQTHWLRGIDAGISLTPLYSAADARQSPSGAVYILPNDNQEEIMVYHPSIDNEAQVIFNFSAPILDMEALGDVNGDGFDELLAYHQNPIATDISHHIYLTAQEGYSRVEISHFDTVFSTSELDLDGDYQPTGDWDGDGLNDFLLHRSGYETIDVFRPANGLYLDQSFRQISARCRAVLGDITSPDGVLVACLSDNGLVMYGADGSIWYEVSAPNGAIIEQATPLSHQYGGLAVLYTSSNAEASIALIDPTWLYQDSVYQIQGTEPHVQSDIVISGIQYLGPIRLGQDNNEVLVSHVSHTDDLVDLFTIPELVK
ncbi:MAG: putative metal-binding motif-containing protein [Myxococcota bacterium]|nr:putative metal-binding motif-containing protein [Myxococcota bacterium]